jgi:hypothetical protein
MQSAAARLAVTVSTGEVPNCERLSALIDDLCSSMGVAESVPVRRQHQAGGLQSQQPKPQPEPEPDSTTWAATADVTEVEEAMSELGQFLPADYLERIEVRRRVAMATTSAASSAVPFPSRELSGGGAVARTEPLWLSPSSRESSYPTPSPPISVEPDPTPP